MKVQCKKCGKRFDAEKYSGLCPNCGTWYVPVNHYDASDDNYGDDRWNRPAEDFDVDQSTIYDCDDCKDEHQKDQTIVLQRQDSTGMPKPSQASYPHKTKKSPATTMAVIIIIIASMFLGGISAMFSHDDDDDYYADEVVSEDIDDEKDDVLDWDSDLKIGYENIETVYGEVGQKMSVQSAYGYKVWYRLDSIESTTMDELIIPAGYQLYKVGYTVNEVWDDDSEDEYFQDSDDVDAADSRDYASSKLNAYIRTKTGTMLEPLYSYQLDRMLKSGIDSGEFEEDNEIDISMCMTRGNLLFLVKEGDYECLTVYEDNGGYEDKYPIGRIDIYGSKDKGGKPDWMAKDIAGSGDTASYIDPDIYVQKIEDNSIFTPAPGINIRLNDWLDKEDRDKVLSLTYGEYDSYFVAMNMTNYSSAVLTWPDIYMKDSDGNGLSVWSLEYSDVQGLCYCPPMSTSMEYFVVNVPKGYNGPLQITYDNIDSQQNMTTSAISIDVAR